MITEKAKEFISDVGGIAESVNALKEKYGISNLKDYIHPMIIDNKFTFVISEEFVKEIQGNAENIENENA